MKNFTIYDFTLGKSKALPIVFGLVLLPILGIGQTKEQVRRIREKSNISVLNKIERIAKKKSLSEKQLKKIAKKKNLTFSGDFEGRHYQLVGFDRWTKAPLYYITHNEGAAQGTLTNRLNSSFGLFNLDGEGMTAYEWDGGGVLTTHQEFGGRATQMDNANGTNDHSTHVAGTLIASGVDSKAKGMAPKAKLAAYEWTDDELEMIAAAKNGALVSNHSYGFSGGFVYGNYSGFTGWYWLGDDDDTEFKGFGKYGETDREWDMIALNAPYYLPVKAAGNDKGGGPEPGGKHYVAFEENGEYVWKESRKIRQKNGGKDGFDIINNGALGKNILTVGAANKIANTYKEGTDVVMASFSSYGPVDDGRIKPDIAGIGVGIYSTSDLFNAGYNVKSGTSMASPNVTGSLLLLQQHYKNENNGEFMKSATLKALITGTANEAGENIGPDYASGWGLLNAYKAATAISTRGKYSLISEETLNNGETKNIEVTASGTEPLKVTIAWIDPILTDDLMPSEALNDRKITLINDLDVKVLKDGVIYYPWKLDPVRPNKAATRGDNNVDNIEQVLIENPVAGAKYQIIISHKNTLRKNVFNELNEKLNISLINAQSQDYSMVVTGINEGVNVDLALSKIEVLATPLEFNDSTPVKFNIQNKGNQISGNGKLIYELFNKKTNQIEQRGELTIAPLNPASETTLTANIDLSKSFVDYIIRGKIEFDEDEILTNNVEETYAYGYLINLRPEKASYKFDFEGDLNKEHWSVEDKDGDNSTWYKYDDSSYAKSGSNFIINFPGLMANETNDWVFTPPIYVKANTKYRVIYNVRKIQDLNENLAVFFGDKPNSEYMIEKLGEGDISLQGNVDKKYNRYSYEFELSKDKIIYIGFNNYSSGNDRTYAVGIDDVVIEHSEGKPNVDFLPSSLSPKNIDVVTLKSTIISPSNDPVSHYKWEFNPNTVDFVNGTTANSQNPEVIFQDGERYSVKLTATNNAGESVKEKLNYIDVIDVKVKAGFTASETNIKEGETVVFTNTSTGLPRPTKFKWTITPEEGVEILKSGSYLEAKFNREGKYTVSLEAKSAYHTDTFTAENYIIVSPNSLATVDLKSNEGLRIYPNPSNGIFVVENESSVSSFSVEIYNFAGKLIYQNKFNGNKAEMNLSNFPIGVYILKITDNNGNHRVAKIITK